MPQARIVERIHRQGPLSFAEYMELALFDPDEGFFMSTGGAGRHGDFITSPEVGPLFGAVLARALDAWWMELGAPDPFFVVEAGAGAGTLCRDVLRAEPACGQALRYLLVERSETARLRQAAVVALEPPGWVLGPVAAGSPEDDDDLLPVAGRGPMASSLAELPAQRLTGVVLANELLDNLPVLLLERRSAGWFEVRVGEAEGQLREVLVPAAADLSDDADRLAPGARDGIRIPLQREAADWVRRALAGLERGRLVVIDFASDTPTLAGRPHGDWLRTYRGHQRGGGVLEQPGAQDITCEVAIDQLARVRPLAGDRSQAEFLQAHGIDDLVKEASTIWRERAGVGDLPAVAARSRVSEADALLDSRGLGAFRVLEWVV